MADRISKGEIESTIEGFVNSIFDEGENSGWLNATEEEWINATYEELVNWKNDDGCCYRSHENRFEGKENLIKRIKPILRKRLNEVKAMGYAVKA